MFCLNLVTSLIIPEIGHQDSEDVKNVQLLVSNKQLRNSAEEAGLTAEKAEKVSKASESTENVDKKDVAINTKDTVEKTNVTVTEEVNADLDDEDKKDTEQVVQKRSVDNTDLVVDEFCSNASYNQEKKEPTSSAPTRPSRGLGSVDYLSMRFEDFCDPD